MRKRRSVSHFTGREQYALNKIRNRMASELSPLLIYHIDTSMSSSLRRSVFWSKPRKVEWLYNVRLLMIYEDDRTADKDMLQRFIGSFGPDIHLSIIECSFTQMKQQLASRNLFLTWIYKRGIVLYNRNSALERLPVMDIGMKKYAHQAQEWYDNDQGLSSAFTQELQFSHQKKALPV